MYVVAAVQGVHPGAKNDQIITSVTFRLHSGTSEGLQREGRTEGVARAHLSFVGRVEFLHGQRTGTVRVELHRRQHGARERGEERDADAPADAYEVHRPHIPIVAGARARVEVAAV